MSIHEGNSYFLRLARVKVIEAVSCTKDGINALPANVLFLVFTDDDYVVSRDIRERVSPTAITMSRSKTPRRTMRVSTTAPSVPFEMQLQIQVRKKDIRQKSFRVRWATLEPSSAPQGGVSCLFSLLLILWSRR